MLGYDSAELSGRSIFELVDEEGKEQVIRNKKRILAKEVNQVEQTFRHKNGHKVETSVQIRLVFDQNGQVSGAISGIFDISHLKQTSVVLSQTPSSIHHRLILCWFL